MNSSFYYSAILFKNIILVDHSDYGNNFYRDVKKLSKKFNQKEGIYKFSDTHNFAFIKEDEIIYFTIIDSFVPEKTVFAFLFSIRDEFNNKINKEQTIEDSVTEYCLKDFENVLEENMKFYDKNNGTIENEALTNLKNDIINFHKEVLTTHEKLLSRKENLSDIDIKAENLQDTSKFYLRYSKKVKWTAKKKRCCIILFSIFAFLVIVYIFIGLKCGFDLNECI